MQKEDNTNLEHIFHQYYSPLCNFALRIVKDEHAAEDVVQNLFIQLWEKDKLSEVKNVEHFLLRSVKFKCYDYLRTRSAEKEVPLDSIQEAGALAASELKDEDIDPLFHYFAAKLPQKTREIFLLSRKSGMTYKEIAEELDISVKTVENQMGRALRMMRKILKEHDLLMLLLLFNLRQ